MDKEKIAVLVKQAQGGDAHALNELLVMAYPLVLKQCRVIMKHPENAEDATQIAIEKIWKKLPTLNDPEKFIPWACQIAANQCRNDLRGGGKELQFAEDEDGNSILDDLEELDHRNVPEKALEDQELKRIMAELMDSLPPEQRDCVYLKIVSELKYREIAQLLGISENTVKSRLRYAMKTLEEKTKAYEEKNGIRLHGMSPVFLLRHVLRQTAVESVDTALVGAKVRLLLGRMNLSRTGGGNSASSAPAGGRTTGIPVNRTPKDANKTHNCE